MGAQILNSTVDRNTSWKGQPTDGGGTALEKRLRSGACGFDPRLFRQVFKWRGQPIDGGGSTLERCLRGLLACGIVPRPLRHG